MLKIDVIRSSRGERTLKLAGRVIGAWVGELAAECERALASERRLVVDLAAVSFVDRRGADLLRALSARNVSLRHPSSFVAAQLGIGAS